MIKVEQEPNRGCRVQHQKVRVCKLCFQLYSRSSYYKSGCAYAPPRAYVAPPLHVHGYLLTSLWVYTLDRESYYYVFPKKNHIRGDNISEESSKNIKIL
jgi:hypothetical protein